MIKGTYVDTNNMFGCVSCQDESITIKMSVPICQRLWKATFAERGEVQGVRLLVHPTRLDVQVLEYVHFALETNLKHTHAHKVSLESEFL